jgi:predicted dehydrogenase
MGWHPGPIRLQMAPAPLNRRRFIAQTPAALAAGSLAPVRLAGGPAPTPAPGGSHDYAPREMPRPVVSPGEFVLAAAHLDHDHLFGQCQRLVEAGAALKWIYEPDPAKLRRFRERYPQAAAARSLDEILDDPAVRLVAAAAVPSERGPLGCRVMEAGKDYFTDKGPFTTFAQLEQARAVAARTGRKYMVYYSERLDNEAGMFATDLLAQNAIGRVIQVLTLAPHRLNLRQRPAWFFERARYGGILCDLGSHQFEQTLTYSGAGDAAVTQAAVGNFANPDHPELEDFGEASLACDNGTSGYVRVDWFTPDGLGTWGDGRSFILGTKGTIELRKYVDVARERTGDQVYLVDERGEHHLEVAGKVGYRFFGELILDCLNRTEKAMTQAHVFRTAALTLRAQAAARRLTT